MLIGIILLAVLATAFWREALKLTIAVVAVVLLLGVAHVAQIVDQAGATVDRGAISSHR